MTNRGSKKCGGIEMILSRRPSTYIYNLHSHRFFLIHFFFTTCGAQNKRY